MRQTHLQVVVRGASEGISRSISPREILPWTVLSMGSRGSYFPKRKLPV